MKFDVVLHKEAITAWLSVDLPDSGDEIISVAL